MLRASPPKKDESAAFAHSRSADQGQLKFISELGRNLLVSVHPRKAAARVTEAIQQRIDAKLCVFAAEIANIGLITYAFGRTGEVGEVFLRRSRFEDWMSLLPPQIGYIESDPADFIVEGLHAVEYVSPLRIEGDIRGAIVTCFDTDAEVSDEAERLIDAATQMAAMSVNLSTHYEATLHDSITEAREEQRRFNEAILDALPVSLYVVDRDYRIVSWNRHREDGPLGVPRDLVIGRDVFDVLEKYPQGRQRQEFERAFRTGNIERIEQQTTAEDGTTRHWMVSKVPMKSRETGEVTHVITIGEDVTVRVEAIHAINRAEKLAAVGRLAAGIVHEINNPLATIAACAEALQQRIEEGAFDGSDASDDLAEYLELIKSEAFRCKNITTDLLDFSRVRAGERTDVDAGEVVRSAANLISHQKRGNGITQQIEIQPDLPPVSADGGQIQQAVIALATNAIDAMPDGGTLTFRVFPRGNRVCIEVADTGIGIQPDNVAKVFEPFFTTKEVGKGTGLGLAVCYGIISEHDGRISVRSSVGKGTTFSIFLPISA